MAGRKGEPRPVRGPGILDDTPNVQWWRNAREADAKFQSAVHAAVRDGVESCATMPSSALGTRCPISGYQRGDLL
jgi:hypothetical protein